MRALLVGVVFEGGRLGMRVSVKRLLFVAILSALSFPASLSAQTTPTVRPTTDELTNTKNPGADWITYGGALNNERYSTLDQINTSNVSGLKGRLAHPSRLGTRQ
jgi:glucose dehydrogenase